MRIRFLLPLFFLAASNVGAEGLEAKIQEVMRGRSVHQMVGPIETPLSEDLANFLLDHPDLSAAIVRAHGIAPYSIEMRGPRQSWADDGDGTRGLITEVSREGGRRVYYGDGAHKSRFFPEILAEAVIVMDMRELARQGCGPHVVSTFDVYVKLKNPLLSRMVRILPFVRKTVIRKFSKAFLVADQVGRLLKASPQAADGDLKAFPLEKADRAEALRLIGELGREPASCR